MRNGEACAGNRPYQMPPAVAPSGKLGDGGALRDRAGEDRAEGDGAGGRLLEGDGAGAEGDEAGGDLGGGGAGAGVVGERRFEAGAEGGVGGGGAGLDQDRLHARVGEDGLGQGVGGGDAVAVGGGQAEEVGHQPPAQLAGDGGVEEQVAAGEGVGGLARAEPAGGGGGELEADLRDREGDVGRGLQQVPADGAAVQAGGAGDGEVAVDEAVDAAAAAVEIGAGGFGDDGVRFRPVEACCRRHSPSVSGPRWGRRGAGARRRPVCPRVDKCTSH